ncbi:MAG: cupin domain-containing protein [Balneolaceae bacterium]|nr:MAG: cupin domain-containing protein [Balneolaceae bacterium]
MDRKEEVIELLALTPHPEGGYFKEVYRSRESFQVGGDDFPGGRSLSTSIYYLLGSGERSLFHRIRSDEVWHHYEGSPVTVHMIHEDSLYEAFVLGKELTSGERPQFTVPAGVWFGVTVEEPGSFALCGCTVCPGFDFRDFEMADRYRMLQAFPEHEAVIRELTQGVT